MSHAIKQHTTPQMHLRHFTDTPHRPDNRKTIYIYDKVQGKSRHQRITEVAHSRYFYDHRLDDGTIVSLEKAMGDIEGRAKAALDTVCTHRSPHAMARHRDTIATFVAAQFVRTPVMRKESRDTVAALNKYADHLGIEREEVDDNELARKHLMQMLHMLPWITNAFLRKAWVLLINKTGKPFWTSDHPVVRINANAGHERETGILSPGVAVYMPFHPEVQLAMVDPGPRGLTVEIQEATPWAIHCLNREQVAESLRYLFSPDDDFALAEETIRNWPEFADLERERVSEMPPPIRDR